MAQLKAQLEAAGFDTAGFDEADLIAKLDQAGFDTSSLGGTPKSGLDKAVDVSKKVTGAVDTLFKPVGMAIGAVKQGSDMLADKLAESGHPFLAAHAAGPSIAIEGAGKAMELLDKAGEKTAEFGGRHGFPKTGAALGTAISMAPDIAAGASAIAKRQLIAQGLRGAGRAVTSPARFMKDILTKPGAAEARLAAQESMEGLKAAGADELAGLRNAAGEAKKALISAEEKAGLHFKTSPEFETLLKDPKRVAKNVEILSRLTEQGSSKIAQNLAPKEIQSLRKFLQEAEKSSGLSDIAQSEMRKAKGVLVDALKQKTPEVVAPLDKLSKAEEAVRGHAGEMRKRVSAERLKGAKSVLEGRTIDKRRKIVKALATAATAGTGLGLFLK